MVFGEPYDPATNSLRFWLTARRRGLAGNGQYCGETVALWYGNIARRSKPDAPLSHSWATYRGSSTRFAFFTIRYTTEPEGSLYTS